MFFFIFFNDIKQVIKHKKPIPLTGPVLETKKFLFIRRYDCNDARWEFRLNITH